MSGLQNNSSSSILPSNPSSMNLRSHAQALRRYRAPGLDTVATSLGEIQGQVDTIVRALQKPTPLPPNPIIQDQAGNVIVRLGYWSTKNQRFFGGAFANLWVGAGADPTTAPFFCNGSQVVIGQNGQVFVFDPYSNVGAWLGTQSEAAKAVTNAVNNGSGLIELTITAHGYTNGDWLNVANVGGVPNATGQFLVSVVDPNTIDLLSSTFAGAYTSGGTANRFFSGGAFGTVAVAAGQRITNAVNNGSGLVRLTITGHGYSTGYGVVTTNVGGVPGANGAFLVTVIDANTIDLQGSTFSGAYTTGGISLNWPTAKFLAQGDGSLRITNATITLKNGTATITLDPTGPTITSVDSLGDISILNGSSLTLQGPGGGNPQSLYTFKNLQMINNVGTVAALLSMGATGTGSGKLTLKNAGGTVTVTIDSGASTTIDSGTGDINTGGVFRKGGTAGLSVTRNMVASITTSATGVFGTPAAGQSNGTVVTGVTFTASTFSGGIITA